MLGGIVICMKHKGLRGEQLGQLYHRAKTPEQRRADEARLAQLQRDRLPKLPRLKIALGGSGVYAFAMLLIGNIEALWMGANFSIIFFTFGVWLLLCYAAVRWFRLAADVYYAYDQVATPFFVVYSLITLAFGAVWLNWLSVLLGSDMWLLPAVLAHFTVGYLCLLLMLSTRVDWG